MKNLLPDKYTLQARYYPIIISTLPLIWLVPYFVDINPFAKFSLGFVIQMSVCFLLAQFVRDRGKILENKLFPKKMLDVQSLRYTNSFYSKQEKDKLHEILSKKCKTSYITESEEQADPEKADDIYSIWCNFLRQNARNSKKGYLLQEENITYGFRRNLVSIKFYSIIFLIISFVFFLYIFCKNKFTLNIYSFSHLIILLLSLLFIIKENETWVLNSAKNYVKQLHQLAYQFIDK